MAICVEISSVQAFPNDYDEILDTQRREAQRLALKAAEEEERRRKEGKFPLCLVPRACVGKNGV